MFLLLLSVCLVPALGRAQCLVEPSQDNVVASQLEGSWTPDDTLNSWLSPGVSAENDIIEMKFYKNETVKFPTYLCGDRTVYMEGEMTLIDDQNKRQIFAFILTARSGNPHVIFYDQEFDLYDSVNVMLARAEDGQDDILFTGDDHNTQAFIAWKRQTD